MRTLSTMIVVAIFSLLVTMGTAKADIIDNISVNASFAAVDITTAPPSVPANPAPDLYLTGSFILDETTRTIASFSMLLTHPSDPTPYAFSSSGGAATASLGFVWSFEFSDARADVFLTGPPTAAPLTGSYFLSSEYTDFGPITPGGPDNIFPFGCCSASTASLNGISGAVYVPSLNGVFSSGTITIVSPAVPEPAESGMLLLGITFVLGIYQRRHRAGRPTTI